MGQSSWNRDQKSFKLELLSALNKVIETVYLSNTKSSGTSRFFPTPLENALDFTKIVSG